ncbi:MAG: sigma 54-interacting transcriptional regulator [Acidobacteriota bacterium]|nr:MAG: sigma 54-interacting transcriptional regulator [Acidobacteriota bacterium]
MPVHAVVIVPPGFGTEPREPVRLSTERAFLVGRDADADIVLDDPRVSSQHARLGLAQGKLSIEDLGSRNGTWIRRLDASERLPAGQTALVDQEASVRIGPFQIVPCEQLAERVLLTTNQLLRLRLPEPMPEPLPEPLRETELDPLLGALLSAARSGDVWDGVLSAMVELAGGRGGNLLHVAKGRFVLRASRGPQGSVCLSQSFLEATLASAEPWFWSPESDEQASWLSSTLQARGADRALVGVRLDAAEGHPVGVGQLELDVGAAPALGALGLLARVTGPWLAARALLGTERRRREALEHRLGSLASPLPDSAPALIGRDPAFRDAVEAVRRAAASRATILLRGPSGSGKELLARWAHAASARCEQPLVVVNSAAIPDALIESELFGHDRGAFTGADRDRAGAFERADGGTLFLDEVGDLSLAAQAKILRVLESDEVVRLGGGRQRIDVRLIAATHRDLEQMIADGRFREDLYFRLRVIDVCLPSLADRREDIAPLAEHFLSQFRRPDGMRVGDLTPRALRALKRYSWPGTVRELRNLLQRAVVLDVDGVIDEDDLPVELHAARDARASKHAAALDELIERAWPEARTRFEELYFRELLRRHGGRVQRSADVAGVDRRTLSTKIRRYGLRDEVRRR